MVHLGVGPGSQAYHLYDPEWRKLSTSRDVVFDKNKKNGACALIKMRMDMQSIQVNIAASLIISGT